MSYEPQTLTSGGRGGGRILPPRPRMTGGSPEWGGRYPMGWGDRKPARDSQQQLWESMKSTNTKPEMYPSVPNKRDFPNPDGWKQPKEMY